MSNFKWLLTAALSLLVIMLGVVCRYKTDDLIAVGGGEFFLALALVVAFGVHERRNDNGTHDKN